MPAGRRASSLPPDYASEQPSIAGLAGTPIYDELAQQERTRRALSVALYAAQSEGRRLAALARSPRAEKPTRPPLDEDTDAPDSPALADLLRVADGWAGATAARRSTSVPPTPNATAPLTPVSELTPIRAAAVATPGTLHRLIAPFATDGVTGNGVSYNYVTRERFLNLATQGFFLDYVERRHEHGGHLTVLPTVAFFHGMGLGQEIHLESEPGQGFVIRLVAIGDPDSEGGRPVFFELNGQPRRIVIHDRTLGIQFEKHAHLSSPSHVPWPLQEFGQDAVA